MPVLGRRSVGQSGQRNREAAVGDRELRPASFLHQLTLSNYGLRTLVEALMPRRHERCNKTLGQPAPVLRARQW
jgi:hypothetical protein